MSTSNYDFNAALPEGNCGIAAKYKNDAGIESDPEVIFADDFENYSSVDDLSKKWDTLLRKDLMALTNDPSRAFRGKNALEIQAPHQKASLSVGIMKWIKDEQDVLFMRYYLKYDETFNILGSCHNGSVIGAHYYIDGRATPGRRADGKNKFLISYEHGRWSKDTPNPGELNIYIYHPEQRSDYGDHFYPTGRVLPKPQIPHNFGPDFVPRPEIIPEPGRWYCYEVMLKANTVNKRDGRVACWLDGKLVADFPNLRLRDVEELKIDHFNLSLYFGNNEENATKQWYDNLVVAKSYIGPYVD